jgi:hypothetical protein
VKSFASVLVALTVIGAPVVAQAKDASALFIKKIYKNPQSSNPLFGKIWPGLIEDHNRMVSGLHVPSIMPAPGQNASLGLDIATLSIDGAQILVSINDNLGDGYCEAIGEPRDMLVHAQPCAARLTVVRNGTYQTTDIGKICMVWGPNLNPSTNAAFASYDAKTQSIRVFALVDGAAVPECEHNISLPQ